jgi:hypothetical protein
MTNFELVNYHIVEIAVSALDCVADLTLPQDQQVKVIIDLSKQLFGVTDTHFNLLSKVVKGLVYETAEERQFLKDTLIAFFEVVFFHCHRERADEGPFLFNVELLADIDAFLNVIGDAPLELIGEVVLVTQLFESLEISTFLEVLSAYVADEGSDPINVIGEAHHAEDFDED